MRIQYDGTISELPLSPLRSKGGKGEFEFFTVFLQKDKHMRAHKGQSTVEYILLVTAVLAVIILFTTGNNSVFQQRLNSVFNTTTQDMLNVASRLQDNAAGQ